MRRVGKFFLLLCLVLVGAAIGRSGSVQAAHYDYTNEEYGVTLRGVSKGDYVLIDSVELQKGRDTLYIPEKIDGKYVIGCEWSKVLERVRHLILPSCFKLESKYFQRTGAIGNLLENMRALETITFPAGSKYLRIYEGGIFSPDFRVLYAVLPNQKKLVIPKETVRFMADSLVSGYRIEELIVEPENQNFCSQDNILYSRDKKVIIWSAPRQTVREIRIPDGVEYIGVRAFAENKTLETVIFPDNLDQIGGGAFENCTSLRNLQFKKNLRDIGSSAFWNCSSLEEVVLPEGLTELGQYVFYRCKNLKSITFPKSLCNTELSYSFPLKYVKTIKSYSDIPICDMLSKFRYYRKEISGLTVYTIEGSEGWKRLEKLKIPGLKLEKLPGTKAVKETKKKKPLDSSWHRKGQKKYYISSAAQLASFLKPGRDSDIEYMKGKTICLTKDIDMKNYPCEEGIYFAGVFDGQNHCIKNLKSSGGIFYNLFGTVKNLRVKGEIEGTYEVGGIVDQMNEKAKVINCHFYGKVTGYDVVGGIVGLCGDGYGKNKRLKLQNCVNHGSVQGYYFVGGVAGNYLKNDNQWKKNVNRGKVKGIRATGSLCGYSGGGYEKYHGNELWDDIWS